MFYLLFLTFFLILKTKKNYSLNIEKVSLYLKYRPQDFENLEWQKFIKQTLQKAVLDDKTVWAYLFCGPRWTGKTSSARIFAKAINCLNPSNWNPCLECGVCKEFASDSLVDIMEIDAASHTWVDNIREIIERAQFAPNKTKYKIYIIDEVHMLSKWAFNALLKILEEPPSHVKFILATTETHKVPDTIISRCQRYDFKSINEHDMIHRLNYIASEEKVTIDNDSLNYIVKNSGWAFRNAISLFEQLIEDNNISYDRVVEKLWIVDEDILKNFLNKLVLLDSSITSDFDDLISSWKNIKLFFRELIFYTKNQALVLLQKWENISSHIRILEVLDESYVKTKNSLDENTTFLIGILKIVTVYNIPEQTVSKNKVQDKVLSVKAVPNIQASKDENPWIFNNPEEPKITEKPKAVSVDDAFDIFSDDATMDTPAKIEEKWIPKVKTWFDVKSYIDSLKSAWAKWGLTMALRGSEIYLQWTKLHIKTKTKIASTQVTNVDNKTLMLQVLQDTVLPEGELVIL